METMPGGAKMSNIIIYLPNEPLGKQGGMERVTHGLASLLRDEGHTVTLLCRNKNRLGEIYEAPTPLVFMPKDLTRQQEQEFLLTFLQQTQTDLLIDQTEGGIIGRWGIFSQREQLALPDLTLIAIQHSSQYSALQYYQLIHRIRPGSSGLSTLKAAIYNNVLLPLKHKRAWRLQKSLFRDLAKNYDLIIPLSPGGMEEFLKLAPNTPPRKLFSIPNSILMVDRPSDLSHKEKRVLFTGRLDNAVKGLDRLLRIWQQIEQEIPDWHLDILGDGDDADWLKTLSRDLQLTRVSFLGFQVPTSYYQQSSIFCMTSTFEGFGMVLIEAMQYGCVPMAFDSYPAVRDIILPGRTGLLIPPFDEQEYAEQLKNLILDADRRESMVQAADAHMQQFSTLQVAKQWNQLIALHQHQESTSC